MAYSHNSGLLGYPTGDSVVPGNTKEHPKTWGYQRHENPGALPGNLRTRR